MEEKTGNWKISELYEKSWQIVKNNKVLWLFGMASAAAGLGGNLGSGNFDSLSKFFPKDKQPPAEKVSQVMGASTDFLTQTLANVLQTTPVWMYVLLGLGIILLILINVILGTSLSFAGLKGLLWLAVVPQLIFFIISAIIFAILFFSINLFPEGSGFIPIILMIIFGIVFLIGLLILNLAQIWAPRRVIIDKKDGRQAFGQSVKMARRKFWKMLGLGAINMILSTVVMMVLVLPILAIVGVWVFGSITSNNFMPSLPVLAVVVVIVAITFLVIAPILSGIINAFKAQVWTLAYKTIKGDFNE
ncbi:MAG: Glycerophosphoryl diester phosphodiesterase, membrane-like protein [Candidatus Daviesbacteria bacterium GW2011_GWB1_41_5]|uniref:Glycerophosphoryl diester phosphodiesterase, membrane-like protein n=1 Tax=Candidatus Daviesbacteria bacterium GW2011_GWB1_41_5 TaxID=1618429 RepID=A0A0G0YQX7_9BACT|nr:MAG: Glycerophosphoryl diester phosphodiesterase, membrane-like protein [Candidatus Daviesbacteria bacterium GW2011_GWB1_41_5]